MSVCEWETSQKKTHTLVGTRFVDKYSVRITTRTRAFSWVVLRAIIPRMLVDTNNAEQTRIRLNILSTNRIIVLWRLFSPCMETGMWTIIGDLQLCNILCMKTEGMCVCFFCIDKCGEIPRYAHARYFWRLRTNGNSVVFSLLFKHTLTYGLFLLISWIIVNYM